MSTKVWYICDRLTKTRLPGYYKTPQKALDIATRTEPRLARYMVNDAWLHELKDAEECRKVGIWPIGKQE